MSFEEAFGAPASSGASASPATSNTHAPLYRKPDGDLMEMGSPSPEMESALAEFVTRAQTYREKLQQGSAMPGAQVENWNEVGRVVDAFLRRPASQTATLDLVRTRVTLEAELEEDAKAYGDIPTALAESVTARVGRLARRMSELKRARVVKVAPLQLAWPVHPVVINSLFGRRVHPVTGENSTHKGLDLRAELGQAIYTAAPGVVLRAGWFGGYGKMVEVQHAGRVTTRYGHLSEVLVAPGEVLQKGDALGLAGDTGLATGVHLHFEIWREGQACDPMDELDMPEELERVGAAR